MRRKPFAPDAGSSFQWFGLSMLLGGRRTCTSRQPDRARGREPQRDAVRHERAGQRRVLARTAPAYLLLAVSLVGCTSDRSGERLAEVSACVRMERAYEAVLESGRMSIDTPWQLEQLAIMCQEEAAHEFLAFVVDRVDDSRRIYSRGYWPDHHIAALDVLAMMSGVVQDGRRVVRFPFNGKWSPAKSAFLLEFVRGRFSQESADEQRSNTPCDPGR
jgi:hypothetical protein